MYSPGEESNIVYIDCDTVNCYRELGSLAPLAVLLLAENLTGEVATRSIGPIEGTRKRLQHIGSVYLEFCCHPEGAAAANWLVEVCHDKNMAVAVKLHWVEKRGCRSTGKN